MSDSQTADQEKLARAYRDQRDILLGRIATLFDAISHGSPEHHAWLSKAIADHFAGRPVEAPRG